jgi:hypothetical protein
MLDDEDGSGKDSVVSREEACAAMHRWREAAGALQRLPGSTEARHLSADLHLLSDNTNTALTHINTTILQMSELGKDPETLSSSSSYVGLIRRARVSVSAGRGMAAEQDLKRALNELLLKQRSNGAATATSVDPDPVWCDVMTLLAIRLLSQRDATKALSACSEALLCREKRHFDDQSTTGGNAGIFHSSFLHNLRGIALWYQGAAHGAVDAYQRACGGSAAGKALKAAKRAGLLHPPAAVGQVSSSAPVDSAQVVLDNVRDAIRTTVVVAEEDEALTCSSATHLRRMADHRSSSSSSSTAADFIAPSLEATFTVCMCYNASLAFALTGNFAAASACLTSALRAVLPGRTHVGGVLFFLRGLIQHTCNAEEGLRSTARSDKRTCATRRWWTPSLRCSNNTPLPPRQRRAIACAVQAPPPSRPPH